MGLASAMSTALTGMSAAETQIDVTGNNIANSQTVGFKASEAQFATQFLQTQSLGSKPTATNGGTNPRQIGLGTKVAEITPNFTQGTIEISSNESDLAIQGDGFFIVEGNSGEKLYTRNGIFKTNSENELVTITGQRVLGFGIDESFQIQRTQLVPLSIPVGAKSVAKATENVFLEGTLTSLGDIADTAQVSESVILGNAAVPRPDISASNVGVAALPDDSLTTLDGTVGGGTHAGGEQFSYRFAFVDNAGFETLATAEQSVTVTGSSVQINNLPTDADYDQVRIYRTEDGGTNFYELDTLTMAAAAAPYVDDNSVALNLGSELDETSLDGNYSYLITYSAPGEEESRPSLVLGPQNIIDGRIRLEDLPTPPAAPADGSFPDYTRIRIYRNISTDSESYFLVDELNPGEDFIDNRTDAEISDLTILGNQELDLDGPKINSNTLLTDIVKRDGLNFENVFEEGELSFTGYKGERSLGEQSFTITDTSIVQDLLEFMENSMGIQPSVNGNANPIPNSLNNIPGETGTLSQGITINNGRIRIVSNNGVDNATEVRLSSFQLDNGSGVIQNPNLNFGVIQEAVGQSAVTDFLVYDTLGMPINVRLTAVLERRDGANTVYRWFADSPDNDAPADLGDIGEANIAVGTGLIFFDGDGNFVGSDNSTVNVQRRDVPSQSPLEFDLDFELLSGLATEEASLNASRQDGSNAGNLTNFIIGEDGVIRGIFSNGVDRDLGQIRLARFGNPTGLEQRGENMFSSGVNSGLPVEGDPGEDGIGDVIAGAVELSNTDIGANLIDLILASTQYRGNSRVITTAQQLFDELLNLRR